MSNLAGGFLTDHLDRPVLDKTGVAGQYRVDPDWSDETHRTVRTAWIPLLSRALCGNRD